MTAAQEPKRRNPVVEFVVAHWLAIVLVVVAAIFVGENRDKTSIDVLWITVNSPLWFVLVVMTLVGVAIGLLLTHRRSAKAETYPEGQSPSERAGRVRKSPT